MDASPLEDLALHKPTRSVSPWSRDAGSERDAIGANGAVLHHEHNPWWSVDLVSEGLIYEIRIVNGHLHAEHFVCFEILSSLDGQSWTKRFYKADDAVVSADSEAPWRHEFIFPFCARHVMICLVGEGMLHLRRIQILGKIMATPGHAPTSGSITIINSATAFPNVRVALIGNCQVSALANLFKRSRRLHVSAVADINQQESDLYKEALFQINKKHDLDFVLSHPFSDNFGELATTKLNQQLREKFATFTNIYFDGLHPDITYVGNFDDRVQSPMGDYHSKIIFACYLRDLSIAECRSMFNASTYDRFGFFRRYEDSFAELEQRDATNTIPFARILREMTATTQTMLTSNHPTAATLFELGRHMARYVNVDPSDLSPHLFNSSLSEDCLWPVYPELREVHNLRWEMSMYFYPRLSSGGRPLTLDEFIAGSYAAYDQRDPAGLRMLDAAHQVLQLPF